MLEPKSAEEVAYHQLDVFTLSGVKCILQNKNGQEYANKIIEEVCQICNELKIAHEKLRHSWCQGSSERANQDHWKDVIHLAWNKQYNQIRQKQNNHSVSEKIEHMILE